MPRVRLERNDRPLLYRRGLPAAFRRAAVRSAGPAIERLKLLHDGVVGQYVTWLAFGAAGIGSLFALVPR
jgi:hypothetical protein